MRCLLSCEQTSGLQYLKSLCSIASLTEGDQQGINRKQQGIQVQQGINGRSTENQGSTKDQQGINRGSTGDQDSTENQLKINRS